MLLYTDRRRLDDLLPKAYKVLSVPEFTHLLNLGSELLACSESPEERRCVVELSSVLLRDHPKSRYYTFRHSKS